jgi:crotonobetainyl-CoA:carnitine CoA-transferase CaiB-like acyl-CoA transferase
LLSVAVWGNSPEIIAAARHGRPVHKTLREDNSNPLSLAYRTADGRFIKLSLFQSDRYFAPLCECLGVPELAKDDRFVDSVARAANRQICTAAIDDVLSRLTLDEVSDRLADFDGAWSIVQTTYEVSQDPQVWENDYLVAIGDGEQKMTVAASPWQFGETRYQCTAAPEHGADTDDILLELGLEYDTIIEHKIAGTVL